MAAEGESSSLALGPQPGVKYPISVLYCGNCSMPIEVILYFLLLLTYVLASN